MTDTILDVAHASNGGYFDPFDAELRTRAGRRACVVMREPPVANGWEGTDAKAEKYGWDDLRGEEWWGWYVGDDELEYVPFEEASERARNGMAERYGIEARP